MNKKGFTLIELLVVVLIIAILAAIALPKYQVARDRARLSGLMTIGKNINDAMDRASLSYETQQIGALQHIDITIKDYLGVDCTGAGCHIKVSGKEYSTTPVLNYQSVVGKNFTTFYPYVDDQMFGRFDVFTDIASPTYDYKFFCYSYGGGPTPDIDRCERVAESMGATCSGASGARTCSW